MSGDDLAPVVYLGVIKHSGIKQARFSEFKSRIALLGSGGTAYLAAPQPLVNFEPLGSRVESPPSAIKDATTGYVSKLFYSLALMNTPCIR